MSLPGLVGFQMWEQRGECFKKAGGGVFMCVKMRR